MVTVSFTNTREVIALRLRGHAGSAEAGRDIICASASLLAYTVAQMARYMESQSKLRKAPKVKLEEGDAIIAMHPKSDEDYAEALHTYFVAQMGFDLLAHNYPQYVDIKHRLVGQ